MIRSFVRASLVAAALAGLVAAPRAAEASIITAVDVSASDPSLQGALSAYVFGFEFADIESFVGQLESDLGHFVFGTYGLIAEKSLIGPGLFEETVTAYFALAPDDPTTPYIDTTGSNFTTLAQSSDNADTDSDILEALSLNGASSDFSAFFSDLESDLGYPVVGRYGVTRERTILSQVGIGDPESPDFIVLHTDYLLETLTSTDLHAAPAAPDGAVPAPSAAAFFALAGALAYWRGRNRRQERAA
jgi:hypothetical protein